MKNLILITSVINTPNIPLSYSKIRSVFTREERYNQTKKTIDSVKKHIPNSKIMLVECSDFTKEEKDYFENECEYILNLWEKKNLHSQIFGSSKSLGEGTMTIEAFKYIENNKIVFDNLFKICGRYWLNDKFDYNVYNNDKLILKKINGNINNIFTSFYKIPFNFVSALLVFLINSKNDMVNCVGYEVLFANFLKIIDCENTVFIDRIGYEGQVTVCGSNYNG